MKTEEAFKIIGGSLSKPGKMPGWSLGIPAKECQTGSKLRKIKNSVCYDCYNSKKPDVFRWHDSGDVQDLDHLNKIYEVCRLTPRKRHWMPTREAWIKDHVARAPSNLIIRFSMPMIDQEPSGSWPHVSTVISKDQPWFGATSKACPSSQQGNQCLDCRMCWDKEIKNISYWSH